MQFSFSFLTALGKPKGKTGQGIQNSDDLIE
jgi:hypothetical protein